MGKIAAPALYQVYVEVAPYPNCGFTGMFTGRVGPAKDMAAVRKLIAEDRRAMGDTYGGLIEAVSTKGRTYRIFKSKGWEEIKL